MDKKAKWIVPEETREKYIAALTDELASLRAKAGIPQDDLAKVIGVSRQTYSTIERRVRPMSWSTYLTLIFFFDYNESTHAIIRNSRAFPSDIITQFNDGQNSADIDLGSFLGISDISLREQLDEQAMYAIRTVLMVEYARCAKMTSDAVVRSFDGSLFSDNLSEKEVLVRRTLKKIKGQGK